MVFLTLKLTKVLLKLTVQPEKRNDSHKDAHRRRTSDPFEQNEDQNAQKQYVEDVCE